MPNPKRLRLEEVPDEDLREFCIDHKIGYGFYAEEKRTREKVDTTITENVSYGTMCMFLQALTLPDEALSIVLVGETGLGKTSWVLKHAPKPAILISHMDDLRKFKPTFHKSIIFDDMSFSHMPVQAQIHITDSDIPRSLHVRYGTVCIPARTRKFFTCNEHPFTEHPAINRRIHSIKVY